MKKELLIYEIKKKTSDLLMLIDSSKVKIEINCNKKMNKIDFRLTNIEDY